MEETLAVSTIVKDEERYIYEWLSFHDIVGVDHFIIYNNNSSDGTVSEIMRWPHQNKITLIEWPHKPGQLSSFQNTVRQFAGEFTWCAFIDCDEFLYARENNDLKETISRIGVMADAIYVHWAIFGSNGHQLAPQGKVIENFTRRASQDFSANRMGKTIARLEKVVNIGNPHFLRTEGRMVTENGEEVDNVNFQPPDNPSFNKIVLNHYFTKSKEEWDRKRLRGRVSLPPDSPDFIRDQSVFDYHDRNDIEDTTALYYINMINSKFYYSK